MLDQFSLFLFRSFMVLAASPSEVVRELIAQALGEAPGLFEGMGGNAAAMAMGDAANRIANRLSEAGYLPPDESRPDGIVRQTLTFILTETPASLILELKRAFVSRQDLLASARYQLAVRIIRELERRGFRITKGFLSAPPSGHVQRTSR